MDSVFDQINRFRHSLSQIENEMRQLLFIDTENTDVSAYIMTFIDASSDMLRALQNRVNTMGTFLQHTTTAARSCESNGSVISPCRDTGIINFDHNVYQDLYPYDTLREMNNRQELGNLNDDELDFIRLPPLADDDVNERPPSGRYFG